MYEDPVNPLTIFVETVPPSNTSNHNLITDISWIFSTKKKDVSWINNHNVSGLRWSLKDQIGLLSFELSACKTKTSRHYTLS